MGTLKYKKDDNMGTDKFEFSKLPETERIAFYGALFAMGAVDGSIDKEELSTIFETIDLDGFSEEGRKTVRGYIITPPPAENAFSTLSSSGSELRFSVMVQLYEVALANDIIDDAEREMLESARRSLMVSSKQAEAIAQFVRKMRELRLRGVDDSTAAETMKGAFSALAGVGVPISAVALSGSVLGLSAAGITSGLAALGLGLGMVPGIGVAVLLGTATFMGVRYLLGTGKRNEKAQIAAERERRAQRVLLSMQETINDLIERIMTLSERANLAEKNTAEVALLKERLTSMKQILERRRRAAEAQAAS
jgi:hypothetical protein